MRGKMNDQSDSLAVIKAILHFLIAGHSRETVLKPRVGTECVLGEVEVPHDAEGLGVRTVRAVKPAMISSVLIRVGEGDFVAHPTLAQSIERVADADVQVRTGLSPGRSKSEPGMTKRSVEVEVETGGLGAWANMAKDDPNRKIKALAVNFMVSSNGKGSDVLLPFILHQLCRVVKCRVF